MNKPIIGMTGYRDPVRIPSFREEMGSSISETYLLAITAAGGNPILIPSLEEYVNNPSQVVNRIDGLVIIGGLDANPVTYGQEKHPKTDKWDDLRDQTELSLIQEALKINVPLLGICRGMQLMNIARGGTLHQHLPERFGDVIIHGSPTYDAFHSHPVQTIVGSELRSIYGRETKTPSAHHQSVDKVGEGLTVSAVAADGVIEGIEDKNKSFCVGIQWHPEEDVEHHLPLFQRLVLYATKYNNMKREGEIFKQGVEQGGN